MISALTNAFENNIANCLIETSDILIEVYDDYNCPSAEQRCYIKTEDSNPVHFTLENPLNANVVFAALNNCIFQSHQQSRCDFLIGNFKKLYFVEIKQVNKGKRRFARTNAVAQLDSSLTLFREKLNLSHKEIIAVISLKAKQVHPLQSAKRVADMVAFKENHNAALMEGQHTTF